MADACVYVITNVLNGKQYVGVTKNISSRMRSHASHTIPTKAAIKNAIKKYGREHFTIEVLEEGSQDYCYEREPYWIENFNTLKPSGYNICTGGRGAKGLTGENNGMFGRRGALHPHFGKPGYRSGVPHTKQSREKMSAARRGKKHSPEAIENMRRAALARSPESRKRAADAIRLAFAKKRELRAAEGA